MKRNVFWLVMGGLAVGWVLSHRPGPPPWSPPRPPGFVVVENDGDRVVMRDRHGRVIEHRRGRSAPPLNYFEYGSDADDDDDNREVVEGLPVPVVPGTRTTVATAEPPQPPKPPQPPQPPRKPNKPKRPQPPPAAPKAKPAANDKLVTVIGLRSATVQRARENVLLKFERTVVDEVLHDEVARGWKAPDHLLDFMIREVKVEPIVRDYGTVYEATLKADLSPRNRDVVIHAYRQEEVRKRLWILGAILAAVLVVLAVISGYIKADEATKGYYTTRLRGVAIAALGAGGALLYQWYART